jgi:hypothetical protein
LDFFVLTYKRHNICSDWDVLRTVDNRSTLISISSSERNDKLGREEQICNNALFKLHVFSLDGIFSCSLMWLDDLITKKIDDLFNKELHYENITL